MAPRTDDLQKQMVIHELGHYLVAAHYGISAEILTDGNYYFVEIPNIFPKTQDGLEQALTIAMGGYAANLLCGYENRLQYLGDIRTSFEHLRSYHELKNGSFQYADAKPGNIPLMVYEPFIQNAKDILISYGGKDYLEVAAEHLLKQLKE
ncbi:MAG: hypothetical protein QW594_03065 [Candidatus Woesearchaeota archaeon]